MKQFVIRSLQVFALLAALALPSFAEESKRGFFEGNLLGGGRIVFFVQGNHAVSAYIFDTAGRQASFAGGAAADNGTFSLTTSSGSTISGTISNTTVTATFNGENITANRTSAFGESEHLGGRFTATANGGSGSPMAVKILIDAQRNIFFFGRQGNGTPIGGFGSVTLAQCTSPSPTPSPTATVSPTATPSATPTPSATASPSATPTPTPHAVTSSGSDDSAEHEFEDEDEHEDHHEDRDAKQICGTFTITLVTGEVVTGRLTFSHGLLLGDFTFNGVVFHFRAPQESSENHLANISTRGFVNTGQGQLIGGFIITGGPKFVTIRALGPSLTANGVSPALADPKIQLFQGDTMLAQNDDWQSASNANEVRATTIAPQNAKESAILIRLEPGHYTSVVTGADGGTGIALVEVFEIDRD